MINPETARRVIKQNDDYCKLYNTSTHTEHLDLPDFEIENLWLSYIAEQALSFEEYKTLVIKTEEDPEIGRIFRKVFLARAEFRGGGLVKGFPKRRLNGMLIQDDEVPARLQKNSFIIRAKAVEQIGADVLQKMLEDADMSQH